MLHAERWHSSFFTETGVKGLPCSTFSCIHRDLLHKTRTHTHTHTFRGMVAQAAPQGADLLIESDAGVSLPRARWYFHAQQFSFHSLLLLSHTHTYTLTHTHTHDWHSEEETENDGQSWATPSPHILFFCFLFFLWGRHYNLLLGNWCCLFLRSWQTTDRSD